jgi:hypothetical protein
MYAIVTAYEKLAAPSMKYMPVQQSIEQPRAIIVVGPKPY